MITISSSDFGNNERIPPKFTSDGANMSPELTWSNLPPGTKQLALLVEDPDAPQPTPWVHWIVYNIPAQASELPEDRPFGPKLDMPNGAMQGENSWHAIGYRGPEPPRGHGLHHYHFRLFALDAPLALPKDLDKDQLLKAIEGHVIGQGDLVGTYERK